MRRDEARVFAVYEDWTELRWVCVYQTLNAACEVLTNTA